MTKRRNLRRRSPGTSRRERQSQRGLHHETLEKRELLAAEFGADPGPRLISVAANSGEQFDLDSTNVLSVAPRELTFRFDGARPLDPATLSAITFEGSGGDGSFNDDNEVPIIPGFLGFADDTNPRIVVARFAETLPDDLYRIQINGFDDTDPADPRVGLRNIDGTLFCPPGSEDTDTPAQSIFMDVEVGPRIVAVVPQPIVGTGPSLTITGADSNTTMTAATATITDPDGGHLLAGFRPGMTVTVSGFASPDNNGQFVLADVTDTTFVLDLSRTLGGGALLVDEVGANATVTRTRAQLRDTVHIYFNNDPLSNPQAGVITDADSSLPVVNRDFYKLIFTADTVENNDDIVIGSADIARVEYDPALNRVTLVYNSDLSDFVPAAINGVPTDGAGTFRLRVGSSEAIPVPGAVPLGSIDASVDAGDLFLAAGADPGATAVGTFGSTPGIQSTVITGGEIKAAKDVIPQWPGAYDVPGLRDYRRDAPIVGRIDTTTGINRYEYNFANLYGLDPQLNQLDNAITPAQEQRAREIMGLFAERLGVEFVETEDSGLQIVTGDLRAIAVSADTGEVTGDSSDPPLSIYRVNDQDPSRGVLIMDAGENWFDGYGISPDNRPSWFVEAVRGIGSLLGIGNTFELPPGDGSGGSSPSEPNSLGFTEADPQVPLEPDFLSDGNVITGQALHRPESDDIDFYRFTAERDGTVTLDAFAQRLENSSLLDTSLKLFQVIPGPMPGMEEFELVASNDDYFSDDSFIRVDLELPKNALGMEIPTDFIVGVTSTGNEDYNGEVPGSGLGGTTEGEYELRITYETEFDSATFTDTNGTELDGDADGVAGGDFNFWFRVARDTTGTGPRMIFVDKTFGGAADGTFAAPFNRIADALAAAGEGDIVRLLPNGGVDGVINTQDDNFPYEIGRGGSGNVPLSDGVEFEVPKGVTVMIDAGAILKLQSTKISVGSESVDEDRSLAALQILGTPVYSTDADGDPLDANDDKVDGLGRVFFTSFDDATRGVDNNTLTVLPQAGNWAGIEYRDDFDRAEGRATWQAEGIFIDYASHADIRYGGGSISPTEPAVTAIQLAESRPTLIHNFFSDNAGAGISADPDSFLETTFHEPQFQRVDSFISDYQRVGPEIYGNLFERNTTNGLFIRVVTPQAGQLEPMTVPGRLDDRDIVHVLTQVLVLQGQPGGHLLLEQEPDIRNVTYADIDGGRLAEGTDYRYRLTFVTEEGRESLASDETQIRTVPVGGASGGTIELRDLPTAPAEFAGRRLYRRNPVTLDYELVDILDRTSTTFMDDGTSRLGLLPSLQHRPDATTVTYTETTGTLSVGAFYQYVVTFVTPDNRETFASDPTTPQDTLSGGLMLSGLPQAPSAFTGRNLYRLNPVNGNYDFVDNLDRLTTTFDDNGTNGVPARTLDPELLSPNRLLPRFDARLAVDPGLIVKLENSRIEAGFGSDFYSEGDDGDTVIYTSLLDDSFGAGGTFNTNNNSGLPTRGDWGGLVFRQDATGSIDFTEIQFGGGSAPIEGGFTEFNAVEILQADVRIANSVLRKNADGFISESIRGGRGFNDESVIFVRGSQPAILENTFIDNVGAAISINPDALNFKDKLDGGRATGPSDVIVTDRDNQGPLIAGNRLDRNGINGLVVRSQILTGESVWDDTDIVHVVKDPIHTNAHHHRGGLRLKSDGNQSLVVKFDDNGTLVGSGQPLDIDDRIGGTLQVLGTPGNPVILTSIEDCTVGAGFTPEGVAQNDTIETGLCGPPREAVTTVDVISGRRRVGIDVHDAAVQRRFCPGPGGGTAGGRDRGGCSEPLRCGRVRFDRGR